MFYISIKPGFITSYSSLDNSFSVNPDLHVAKPFETWTAADDFAQQLKLSCYVVLQSQGPSESVAIHMAANVRMTQKLRLSKKALDRIASLSNERYAKIAAITTLRELAEMDDPENPAKVF